MNQTLTVEKTIAAPAEEVWALLAKKDGVDDWFSGVITSCRVEGDRRYCMMMGKDELEERILDVDHEARVFKYAIDKHPMPASEVVAAIHVDERENGAHISWSAQFTTESEDAAEGVKQMLRDLYGQGINGLDAAVRGDAIITRISQSVASLGGDVRELTVADMTSVDQFHIGGAQTSEALFDGLQPLIGSKVADIGAGLGGPARLLAHQRGVSVTGFDIDGAMVRAGNTLSAWAGISDHVKLVQSPAEAILSGHESFDDAISMHVHMFLEEPARMFAEAFRILKPGGRFALLDPVVNSRDGFEYPVPWSPGPERDLALSKSEMVAAATGAGFRVEEEIDASESALAWFKESFARREAEPDPAPLGLHLVVGPQFPLMAGNAFKNLEAGRISLLQLILRKPS